jgi:hypothetical protein
MPSFFVADLLYPLCFKHLDTLGSLQHPSKTGFSSHLIASATVPKARRPDQEIGTPPGDT